MSQAWNGTKKESPERRTYTVEDITQILGIGRTSAYLLVKEGHFKIVRMATPYAFPSGHSMSGWSHLTYDLERKYRYGFDYQTEKELFHRIQLYG